MLHLRVHDSSRLEWIAEVPLPVGRASNEFDLELRLDIPDHIWTHHDQWARLQLMARLSSPTDEMAPENVVHLETVDDLRRSALAAARRAKRDQVQLETEIFSASSLLATSAHPSLGDDLLAGFHDAMEALRRARDSLGTPRLSDAAELRRERPLAEEFMSNYVIELIFRIEQAIATHLLGPRLRHPEYQEDAARVRARLATELAAEIEWRKARGLTTPSDADPWELERYVGRVNLVRRHFQGLLYLNVQTELSDARFRPLFATIAATLGGLFVFPLALFLTGGFGITGLSVGLTGSALLVAFTYGVRERIKEYAKSWLSSRVNENLGGRLALLSTTPRLRQEAERVLRGRESFSLTQGQAADPMHPDLGKSLSVKRFRYRMKGVVFPVPGLAEHGSERVKMVFRYDLSPLFARLDDPIKKVPVLAADGVSLRFVEAARCYRIPVQIALRCKDKTWEESGTLVTHKLGLERIERWSTHSDAQSRVSDYSFAPDAITSIASGMLRRQ